jgi:ABC-2 type transport system ATP-binding protein
MLEIKDFSKSYKSQKVLQISDLQIPAGIYWFVGANGSGKSTFFRSVAGMLPFEGHLKFDGIDSSSNTYRFKINYSEAEPQYPDFLSGQEILAYIAEVKKSKSGQLQKLVDQFGVGGFWKQNIGTYSSGMLKKIALISGFLGDPSLIILDEPFILIDHATVDLLYTLIVEYAAQGKSFFLSSHQDLAPEMLCIDGVFKVANNTVTKL